MQSLEVSPVCADLKLFAAPFIQQNQVPQDATAIASGSPVGLKWLRTIHATHHSVHNSPSCGSILMRFPYSLVCMFGRQSGADPTLTTRNNLSAVDLARPGVGRAKQLHHEAPLPSLQLSHHCFCHQAKRIRCPCKTLAAVRVEAG